MFLKLHEQFFLLSFKFLDGFGFIFIYFFFLENICGSSIWMSEKKNQVMRKAAIKCDDFYWVEVD